MSMFHDGPDPFDQTLPGADSTILATLESYWQSLRHARQIPARNDIAPRDIDAMLPYAFILHRVAPRVARFRVAGQKIHDLVRMDARGMPFSILFAPNSRDALCDLLETAFTQPAIVAAPLVAPSHLFRAPLTATVLFLPLRDEKGQTSRVLGAIVTNGDIGNRPRRFDLATGRAVRIDNLAINLASSQPAADLPPKPQKPGTMRPALRLVVNNS